MYLKSPDPLFQGNREWYSTLSPSTAFQNCHVSYDPLNYFPRMNKRKGKEPFYKYKKLYFTTKTYSLEKRDGKEICGGDLICKGVGLQIVAESHRSEDLIRGPHQFAKDHRRRRSERRRLLFSGSYSRVLLICRSEEKTESIETLGILEKIV